MNDWYYYFFSTTSQVLGCILGLYGLFFIFKIQELKNEMLGLANNIKESLERFTDVEIKSLKQEKLINILNECIMQQNIKQSLGIITDITDKRLMPMVNHYRKLYYFHKSFRQITINTSIFAAIIIVLSLLFIIVGQFIPDFSTSTPYNEIHIIIAIIVFILSSICIFLFISILKKSMAYIKVDVPIRFKILRRIQDAIHSTEKQMNQR